MIEGTGIYNLCVAIRNLHTDSLQIHVLHQHFFRLACSAPGQKSLQESRVLSEPNSSEQSKLASQISHFQVDSRWRVSQRVHTLCFLSLALPHPDFCHRFSIHCASQWSSSSNGHYHSRTAVVVIGALPWNCAVRNDTVRSTERKNKHTTASQRDLATRQRPNPVETEVSNTSIEQKVATATLKKIPMSA